MARLTGKRLCLILLVVAVLISLMIPLPFSTTDRVARAWWDFLHVPAFAVLMYVGLFVAPKRWLTIGILAMVLVPAIEYIQMYTGRETAVADIYLGVVGVGIGALWWTACRIQKKSLAIIPMLGLWAVGLWCPLAVLVDRNHVQRAFPVLVGFDSRWVPSRWQVTGCTIEKDDAGWFARVASTDRYPGLFMADVPSDWSKAQRWLLDVELTNVENAVMWVRLDDRMNPTYYERFQEAFQVTSGVQRIEIPRCVFEIATGGRTMDLQRVKTAGIFFTDVKYGTVFRIKRMELTLKDH